MSILFTEVDTGEISPERVRGSVDICVGGIIKSIDLAKRSKASLQIIDDSPGQECVRAVCGEALPPVYIMVYRRLLVIRVSEV